MPRRCAGIADAKQEALREMHILLTLSHPNLIQIREVVCNEELDTWCSPHPHRITQRIPLGRATRAFTTECAMHPAGPLPRSFSCSG